MSCIDVDKNAVSVEILEWQRSLGEQVNLASGMATPQERLHQSSLHHSAASSGTLTGKGQHARRGR